MISEIVPEAGGFAGADPEEEQKVPLGTVLKSLLFRVSLRHQPSIKRSKVKGSFKTRLQLIFIVINTLQILSATVEHLSDVKGYENYRYFHQATQGVRPDLWALGMGQAVSAVLVSLSILLLSVGCLILETVIEQFAPEKKLHVGVRLAVDWPLVAVQKYIYIPLFLLLFQVTKHTLFSTGSTDPQYSGAWEGILSVLIAVGYLTTILLRVGLVYDSAWFLRTHKLLAHINSSYELKERIVLVVLCALSVVDMSALLHLAVTCALTTYLFAQLLWFVPYYSSVAHLLKALQYGVCSWACVCGFVGIVTDSMTVAIKLFVFVAPCLGLLIRHFAAWRVSLAKFERVAQPFWKFELAVRQLFEAACEERESALTDLKQALDFGAKMFAGKHKEYYLLMAHYHYYLREDPEIALVRMTSAALCPGGLLSEFQIFRFSQALYHTSKSEERDFVDYQTLYQNARNLDCKLCEMTYDLLNVVVNKNTNEKLLERSFLNLAKVIRMSQESYRSLKAKFPNDPFVLQSYGTFVGDLFHEQFGGDLITRGYFELNRRKKTHINTIESYSSVDTGVMVVSCHPKFFGKITFANIQLGKILGCKNSDIIGKDLDDFIPPPFNYKHNNKLVSFLTRGEAHEIFRSHLFLSSNQKFSVEVTFRFRPTVVSEIPYFIVAVRPKPNTREFTLYDSSFTITSHSLFFPTAIGLLDKKSLTGEKLEDILPGVTAYAQDEAESGFIYKHPEREGTFGMKFAKVQLGRGTISWLYVITSERGIEDLFVNTAGEDIALFKKSLKGSTVSSDDRPMEEKSEVVLIPVVAGPKPQQKDPPFHSKETRDEFTATTSVVTSYAKSFAGFYVRRDTCRAVSILKASYLVMILLLTLLLVVCLAVLYATLQEIAQSSEAMELGLSRMHLIRAAHIARRINLVQSGYEPEANKGALQGRLAEEISQLGSVMDRYLKGEDKNVVVGSLINGKNSVKFVPLITALTDFNAHAQFQVDSGNAGSTDFYYTYYNGMSELLDGLNRTVDRFVSGMGDDGLNLIAVTSGTAFLLMGLVLVGSNLCIARCMYRLERSYTRLWKLVINVPTLRIREIMNIHKDRIELVHGSDYMPVEQSRLRQNLSIQQPPKRRTVLVAKVSIFALGSTAFVLFLLFYGYSQTQMLLQVNSKYINEVSYATALPTLVMHLLKEQYLCTNTTIGYFDIVKENQHVYSPAKELLALASDMSRLESQILTNLGDIAASQQSGLFTELNLPYFSACVYLNASAPCADTSLAKGQHATITELEQVVRDFSLRIRQGSVSWAKILALEDYIDMITDATVLLLEHIHTYASDASERFTSDMLTYSCVYVLASGLLYCLLYLPTTLALKRQCLSLWRITTLIRNDYVSQKGDK